MMVSRADICLLTKKKIIHFNASFLFFLSKNSFNFYENFAVSVFFFSKSRRVSRAHNKGRSLSLSVQIYQPHIIQTQVKTCSSRIGHCVHSVNKYIVWSLSSRELRRWSVPTRSRTQISSTYFSSHVIKAVIMFARSSPSPKAHTLLRSFRW